MVSFTGELYEELSVNVFHTRDNGSPIYHCVLRVFLLLEVLYVRTSSSSSSIRDMNGFGRLFLK